MPAGIRLDSTTAMMPPLTIMGFVWTFVIALAAGLGFTLGSWIVTKLLR